ncbi:MAG: oxidoreductase C-terminal domain-containing protein, partial [Anaerolineales bacterium]
DPHIYAAGDIAAWPDPTFNRRLRVEHWDVARRQGRLAGRNMAGENDIYSALPYFFSDLFDLSFEVWGNLSQWERTVTRGSLSSGSFAIYYFDDGRLTGVLAVNRPDEERVPMQSLVESRAAYQDIADDLQDEKTDLAELTAEKTEEVEEVGEELSFSQDIRPLFRDKDISEMKGIGGFDLSEYEDVRQRASSIYARLADGSMPCDKPWSEERVAKFKRWMDAGSQP